MDVHVKREEEEGKTQLVRDWEAVLDPDTLGWLWEQRESESEAVVEELRRCVDCTQQMMLHMREMAARGSKDDQVRVPFSVGAELDRLLTEGRHDDPGRKSDLLPSDVVEKTNQFIETLQNHANPLFFPMQQHQVDMGIPVLEWYVRSEINCRTILCERRLSRKLFVELLLRLTLRFQKSRATPGNLATLQSVMNLCEPQQQTTLNLRHVLNKMTTGTEGIPRFSNLVGLTVSAPDCTLTCRLRTEADTPKNTGYALLWDKKPGLTEAEKIVFHFQQLDALDVFPHVLAVDYERDVARLLETPPRKDTVPQTLANPPPLQREPAGQDARRRGREEFAVIPLLEVPESSRKDASSRKRGREEPTVMPLLEREPSRPESSSRKRGREEPVVKKEPGTEGRTLAESKHEDKKAWFPLAMDGDRAQWKYPHASKYAFCITIDVQALARRGADLIRILQRIRTCLGYEFVLTAWGNSRLSCARVYGRLLAVSEETAERLRQAEDNRLWGEHITADHVIRQYGSQKGYLENMGRMVVQRCLPKTHFLRVTFQPETRTAQFLLHKSVHHVTFLRQFCSRPEIEPQSVQLGDVQLTAQYFGIQVARQMLRNEFLVLVGQYVTPVAGDLVAASMTCSGKLVPLDYRFFQNNAADSLTEGAITRGKAAAQKAAREGVEIAVNRPQTAYMMGCPAPVGPDFERARLHTSTGHTNQFLAHHDNPPVATTTSSDKWDPRWNDFFGRDDFQDVFEMKRSQYDVFPMQSHSAPPWVGEDLEARFLFHRGLLRDERQLSLLHEAQESGETYRRLLERSQTTDEAIIGQALRVYRSSLRAHETLLRSRDPATTEIEARLVSSTTRFSLDLDATQMKTLCDQLAHALDQTPVTTTRTDRVGEGAVAGHRLRIEAPRSRWCTKRRLVPIQAVDEGLFQLRLSVMEERGWETDTDKSRCEFATAFRQLEEGGLSLREKTRHTFDLDHTVSLTLDHVRVGPGPLGGEAPHEEFCIEVEQQTRAGCLDPLLLYVFFKYTLLLSNFVTFVTHHRPSPSKTGL